jgi:CRISPR-associated protein Csm2
MPNGHRRERDYGRSGAEGMSQGMRDLLAKITLAKPSAELFDDTAKGVAREVAGDRGNRKNKPSQIRRFFDELCMWEAKAGQSDERVKEYLPFIRMMNAKASYALGRELVDENFRAFFLRCTEQIENAASLRHAKLFFEAFLGFYKVERPKD